MYGVGNIIRILVEIVYEYIKLAYHVLSTVYNYIGRGKFVIKSRKKKHKNCNSKVHFNDHIQNKLVFVGNRYTHIPSRMYKRFKLLTRSNGIAYPYI